MHLLCKANFWLYVFAITNSLALHVVISRRGRTRTGEALGYEFTWKRKLRPALQGEEGTAYCLLPLHTHACEHMIPYCVQSKRSSATVDALSTTTGQSSCPSIRIITFDEIQTNTLSHSFLLIFVATKESNNK